MEIILWIVFGGLVGWASSLIVNTDDQQGVVLDVVIGIVGALVGGYVMQFFGYTGVSGFNFYSFFVAVVGAVLFLFILKLIRNE